MQPLVAVVGPTGAGKSDLALRLAEEFNGEIVSADSRQVYRRMDIGTAKPTKEQMRSIAHHLIDIVNPDGSFSLAEYQRLAVQAIADIHRRHKLPLIVGGTGQYVWAVVEGWEVPRVAPDTRLRTELEKQAADGGAEALYQELVNADPDAAKKIDPRNVRRVIRAIEVWKTTEEPFSRLKKKTAPPFRTLIIGLTAKRDELYRRIDARVDAMIDRGLIEEVKSLISAGFGFGLPAMSGIGYRQIAVYLQGGMQLEEAVRQVKTETHRFVRHQYNWFRLTDERIRWFDSGDTGVEPEVVAEIRRFLNTE